MRILHIFLFDKDCRRILIFSRTIQDDVISVDLTDFPQTVVFPHYKNMS